MNTKRVVVGGLVAGVAMFVVDGIANGPVLMNRYKGLTEAGVFRAAPRLPFFPVWLVVTLLLGIGLAWIYAAVRPRLGPGPRTAVIVGIVVGLMATLPGAIATYAWTYQGGFVSAVRVVTGVVASVVGTLVAGAIYKEPAAT